MVLPAVVGLPENGIFKTTLPALAIAAVPVGIGALIIDPPLYATIV